MSSNSVCNHTRDKQLGLPLRDFAITRMTTDRIGLHSVLLPLLIGSVVDCVSINPARAWRRLNHGFVLEGATPRAVWHFVKFAIRVDLPQP